MKLPQFGIRSCIEKIVKSARSAFFEVMGKKSTSKTWRHRQVYEDDEVSAAKRQKLDGDQDWSSRKKKVAMMLMYSGKGYLGMQRNPGFKTIEEDLLAAFVKAGIVRPDHIEQPGAKMGFQRAARTDKGVSAAGQVVSFKMFIDVEDGVKKINENLPEQIKVFGYKKVTKGFDCKKNCSARTYTYIAPTFAFAPITENVTESYRITEEVLEQIQHILNIFCGTRNFHNYTSGKKSSDRSANRYIMDYKVGQPFIRDDIEYVALTIKGQSFMLHQIRKMSGMTMAVCRGFATVDTIKQSWKADRLDIPKAPPLGLLLDQIHYDTYNNRFGKDGQHEAIDWSEFQEQMNEFKEKYIYSNIYKTEKEEKSMMKWLATLPIHHYGVSGETSRPMFEALQKAEGRDNVPEMEEENAEAAKEVLIQSDEIVDQHEDEEPQGANHEAKAESAENIEEVPIKRTEIARN